MTGLREFFLRVRATHGRITPGLAGSLLGVVLAGSPAVWAMHETDHRFTVEGFVCGADRQPVPGIQVMAKDTRVSVGGTALTDDRGYYKVTLHLHNDNRGDPILVTARDEEQRVTAQFDVKDVKSERKVAVNFGAGCEVAADEAPDWLYYGAGATAVVVAAGAGFALLGKRRKHSRDGKGKKR
jgi:hypothetical protein